MDETPAVRRLAAIVAADVVGYSRLMEAHEERTLAALKHHRREFIDPAIDRHGGRIFKVIGDGMLVEFGSVLNAARCAIEIQRGMIDRNAGIPEDRHIRFRIGMNVGDLIVDGEDFYGDGVNIAARLESLAPPGGISCSAVVRTQLGNRIDVELIDQGEKVLKNIEQPVRVFFFDLAPPASSGKGPAASRSDKPSVAVLPFTNMSNDPEQEFFSDGITEDIITDLSKVSGLFVLSRNTVFATKGKALNLQQVAKQLGVAYLVEGSVRKAGNRVRITAQLIEGATDGHIWAERYDRDLTDIFAVQDEITQTIVAQLKVKLLPEEKQAIEQAPTQNVEAYTSYLRGRQLLLSGTKDSIMLANRMFQRATELDPNYALAHAGMANCASTLLDIHDVRIPVADITRIADRAIALQPDLAEAHTARGMALTQGGDRNGAKVDFERALELDPNSFDSHYFYARFCTSDGEFAPAVRHFMRAMELAPDDYNAPLMLQQVLTSLGREEDAASYARIGIRRAEAWLALHPDDSKPAQLGAVALACLKDYDRAREWLARALSIDPDDNLVRYNAACTYAMLGEADRAIDLLEVHLKLVGKDQRLWFLHDGDLDSIRDHPRYPALLTLFR
jgi:adenylate cyclase